MLGFRVWNSDSKEMTYGIEQGFCILPDGNFTRIYPIRTGPVYVNPGVRFIPMQSTGYRDMHQEREIFEGDILWHGSRKGYYLVTSVYQFYKDMFEEGGEIQFDEIGIIGNAMQNPELLEKLK